MVTKDYAIKRKLMQVLYPAIEVVELKVPKKGGVSRYRYLTADQFDNPKEMP